MKLIFKRDGRVYLGRYEIGYLWKPDPRRRLTMGKQGVWNFMFSAEAKAGRGLKLIRDLGMEWSYTDPKFNDLKDTLRKILTAKRAKQLAEHCETIEEARRNRKDTFTEEERASMNNFMGTLNNARDMFRKP